MRTRVIAALLAAAVPRATAVCIEPEPTCLPADVLSRPLIDALNGQGCHDTIRLDGRGRDLDPAADPWPAFARRYGDEAIPFYESVISGCEGEGETFRVVALNALAQLRSPRAVAALRSHIEPDTPRRSHDRLTRAATWRHST